MGLASTVTEPVDLMRCTVFKVPRVQVAFPVPAIITVVTSSHLPPAPVKLLPPGARGVPTGGFLGYSPLGDCPAQGPVGLAACGVHGGRKERQIRCALPSPGLSSQNHRRSPAVRRCPGPSSEDCCWGLGSGTGTFVALNFHSHSDAPVCSWRFVTARLPGLLFP